MGRKDVPETQEVKCGKGFKIPKYKGKTTAWGRDSLIKLPARGSWAFW